MCFSDLSFPSSHQVSILVIHLQGAYTRITLRQNLYIGGYSKMASIAHRVNTNKTFVGCIQHLIINGYRYDFRKGGLVGDSEFGVNVGEFSYCCSEYCFGVFWGKLFKILAQRHKKGNNPFCVKLTYLRGTVARRYCIDQCTHMDAWHSLTMPGLGQNSLSMRSCRDHVLTLTHMTRVPPGWSVIVMSRSWVDTDTYDPFSSCCSLSVTVVSESCVDPDTSDLFSFLVLVSTLNPVLPLIYIQPRFLPCTG